MFKIAFFFVWLTVFTFPWQNIVVTDFGTISRLVGLPTVIIAGAYILLSGKIKRFKLYYWLIFLFTVLVGFSYFWSRDQSNTLVYFTQFLQLFGMVWLLYEFTKTEKNYFSLLYAYLLGCFVSAGNTIYNYLTSTDIYANRWVADGFNANYLAYTLSLALPIAWYLFMNKYKPKVSLLYLPIGVFSIIITGSRTASIGLIVFLVFMGWDILKKKFKYKKRIITLLILSAPYIYSKIPTQTLMRLMSTASEVSGGDLNQRTLIWDYAIASLGEVSVLFGGGAGAFPISAHNVYLGLMVELGVVGLIVFLLIILYNVVLIKRMKSYRDKWLWSVMLIMWFVFSNMATIGNEKMTWFLFGMIPVCYHLRQKQRLAEEEFDTDEMLTEAAPAQ